MNDPGADDTIKDAEQTNSEGASPLEGEWEEEEVLLKPSRWWFASTAFPLMAGTFGPVANAFNICALVQRWREYIPVGKIEGYGILIKDPPWLIGINALSFCLAVIANAALMLNMVGRLRFSIAQPITIVGFFVASLLLIALIGIANTEAFRLTTMAPGSDRALTPAYYFACFAAGLYFMLAGLMIFTVWGAIRHKYPKNFQISKSQQTLMMQTISLMAYLIIGAGIFKAVEGWRYNDAIYWADFTLLTIGIGTPFVPETHAGRTLVIFYTFGGIIAIGLVINSIRAMLLEKGAQKMHARTVEKKRQNVIKLQDAEWGRGHWYSFAILRRKKPQPPKYTTERDKRRAEFHAMRSLQERVTSENQYRALAISSFNAAVLWLIGALVFWFSEQHMQHWTYFEAVYFSWVVLITLGYGDLQPTSNAGKAFFVLWTLLAVPTLTVLISDMSDTVVAGVSNLTNTIGALTVAPGDASFFSNLRKQINRLSGGKFYESYSKAVDTEKKREEEEVGQRGEMREMLEHRLKDYEKRAIEEYARNSDSDEEPIDRDIHFYHFVLVNEVKAVLKDTAIQPPKKYTYDEWAYYLRLLGHDEDDSSFHADAYNKPKKDDEDAPQVSRILDHDGNPREWSWLSLRSPLLGLGTEAEWILRRLLNKLQGELRFTGKPGRGSRKGDHPPPFGLAAFRGQSNSSGLEVQGQAHGVRGKRLKELESTFDVD